MCDGYGDYTVDDATMLVTIANLSLTGLANCNGASWSICRDAFEALYDAEDALTVVLNNNVDSQRNCIPCDLGPAISTAKSLNAVSQQLYNLGYGQSIRGDLAFTMQQWKDGFECGSSSPPDDLKLTHSIEGTWRADDGRQVTIRYDEFRGVYTLVMEDGARSDAVFRDTDVLYASNWGAIGYVTRDGQRIRWSNQVWTRGDGFGGGWDSGGKEGSRVQQAGYYLFRVSGSGYRKKYAGYADKIDGYQYYIRKIEEGERIDDLKDTWVRNARERSQRACASPPPTCPCAASPDIWVSGPTYEVVDFSEDYSKLWEQYKCERNERYKPCIRWNTESIPITQVPCN